MASRGNRASNTKEAKKKGFIMIESVIAAIRSLDEAAMRAARVAASGAAPAGRAKAANVSNQSVIDGFVPTDRARRKDRTKSAAAEAG